MKRVLKILAGLVAIAVVAAVALPMFISAEYLKAQLQTQVKKATGRTLDIKGKATLAVFPTIAVHVEDVTLGNPEGFAAPYLVHMDVLEAGAALKPLLAKELRITGITLEGAKIYLEQTASGAKNWEFAKPTASSEAAPVTNAQVTKASPLKQLAIGRVTVKNSDIYVSKAGAKPMALENINLALDGADGSGPLSLNGSADYQKQAVTVKLGIEQMKALLAGKSSDTRLSITLPSGNVNFDGKASTDGPNASGKLSFTTDNLAALMAWATGAKPAGNLPKKVTLASQLALKGTTDVTLDDLTFSADALSGSGKLVLNLGGSVPAINGALTLGTLDLDAFTGKAPSVEAGGAGAAPAKNTTGAGWSDAPLNLAGLRAVNANLKLAIEKVTSGKLVLSNIATDLALNGGNAKIAIGNLSLYGGAAKGTVGLDGSGNAAGLTTNLALNGVDIDALMTALSGASKLKGTANLSVNVNGRGASQRALIGSLSGGGNVKIADGAIKGINIASFLRDAKKGFILGDSSTQSTDFTEMTASYSIAQGVVSNKDLLMKSPILRLTGTGTISLPARTINYRVVPSIVGTLKGQGGKDALTNGGLDIPLIITGPWSAISITPDLAGLVGSALKDPAALQQNLKDIGGSIGKFNSPKDIGAALLGGTKEAAPAAATPATVPTPATNAAPAPAVAPSKEQQINDAIGGVLGAFGK